jgi:hypothetical protein
MIGSWAASQTVHSSLIAPWSRDALFAPGGVVASIPYLGRASQALVPAAYLIAQAITGHGATCNVREDALLPTIERFFAERSHRRAGARPLREAARRRRGD